MKIGAQMFNVREFTKTLEGLDDSLKKVADIGYEIVQISGTCEYDPMWMKDTLQKYNLTCAITHTNYKRLIAETEAVVREHAVYGCKNIGIGIMPKEMLGSLEGYEAFKKEIIPVALKMRDLGVKLQYHNHWQEFEKFDGKDVMQRMIEEFPEDAMDFTFDLGWAASADADVLALIDQLKGRLSRIHLKDYLDLPEDGSITGRVYLRPMYEGKLPYDVYIPALKEAGCEYALVEQDKSYGEDPFDCLKRSYENVISRFPELK